MLILRGEGLSYEEIAQALKLNPGQLGLFSVVLRRRSERNTLNAMETKANETNTSKWVDDRLARLRVVRERPTADYVLGRLRQREIALNKRHILWRWVAVAVVAGCALLAVMPSTRVVARQLWNQIFQTSVDFIRVKQMEPEKTPDFIAPPANMETVADLAEATRRAGFVPHLPRADAIAGLPPEPILSVGGGAIAQIKLSVAEMTTALKRAGANDALVPQNWDGVVIRLENTTAVLASYGDVILYQALPNQIIVPAGFPFGELIVLTLRQAGLGPAEAAARRDKFCRKPVLLLEIPSDFLRMCVKFRCHR